MKKLLTFAIIAAVIGGLIFAFIEGREEFAREREREKPVETAQRLVSVKGEAALKLEAEDQAQSGIAVAPLKTISQRLAVRAFGTVLELQELSELRSGMETAAAQLKKAQAALEVAQKEFERQRLLREQNQNVSEKAFQAAEGAFRTEEANTASTRASLRTVETNARLRWGNALVEAMQSSAPEVEKLLRLELLLGQITIPSGEKLADAPQTITVSAPGGKSADATLFSAIPRADPKLQGRSFLYLIPAKESALLPGVNFTALLPAGEPQPGALVPESAVVWFQGKAWIFLRRDKETFVRREITTDQPADAGWVQPRDFGQDAECVVQGAQALLSEEFRAQIPAGEEGERK